MVLTAKLDLREPQVLMVLTALRASKELPELTVLRDQQDQPVNKEQLDQQVLTEPMALTANKDQ
jgi:hypothetical protein